MHRLLLSFPLWLLLASPASGVLHDRPGGSTNTSPPPNDPGFAHVANVFGLSAVYLGNGWMLSAAHVATGTAHIDGYDYPPLLHSRVLLQPEGDATLPPDLALWRLAQPWPDLPTLPIRKQAPSLFESVLMIGNGAERTGTTTFMDHPGYTHGGAHTLRWGLNAVELFPSPKPYVFVPATNKETHAFAAFFDCTCTETGDDEAIGVNGDSGGAAFIGPRLAGIIFANGKFELQPADTVVVGNVTWIADLSVYRDQILALTAPEIPHLPGWGPAALAGLLGLASRPLLRWERGARPAGRGRPRA